MNLAIWQRCMSNFELKRARFCLRPFYAWFWAVNIGIIGSCSLSAIRAHSKSCKPCFVWKCEKSERIKIYEMVQNVRSAKVWSTHLVSTCSKVYPLFVLSDNLVGTEWLNFNRFAGCRRSVDFLFGSVYY